MKYVFCWALLGSMVIGFGALAAQPDVAVYAFGSEVMIFWDPSDTYSNEIIAMNNMYEQLIRYDPFTDTFQPVLAERYEKSHDGLAWTFYLRKGVKFHTGNELTAEAVKFSIERTIKRGMGASYIWAPVKEIEVVDRYTVRFHLKYPAPLDLIASAAYAAFVFDPQYSDHEWFAAGRSSGTGPYMVEAWKPDDYLILKKFDDYWRGWEGKHFDKVIFKVVPESSTRRLMLELGTADFTHILPITDVEALKGNPAVEIVITPSFQNLVALFNTQKPPLDNVLVRRALAYTIPYKDIIDGVRFGYARQSRGVVPYGLWGYSDHVKQYTYDLEAARFHLAQAGFPEGGFKLLLTHVAGDEDERRVAELWKSTLAKLGIELEIRAMPWAAQVELGQAPDPAKRQDIFLFYWWPDYAHPHSFLREMFGTRDEILFNFSYYTNPLFDELIAQAEKLAGVDRAKAVDLYVKAQNILMEEVPGIAIYDLVHTRVKRTSLKGYVDNPAYPHVVFWYDCWRE